MFKLIRKAVCGVAILVASHAAPASAQNAVFSEIRDAVPLRYFDSATTAAQPGAPNTLVIGFHETDPFRASAQVDNTTGTRLAADTLSVVITAPPGHYISSITCHLSGSGALNLPADARAAGNCVVNGQPEDLTSVGGAALIPTWSLSSQPVSLAGALTTVPVSLTAQLFAFAAIDTALAQVDLTSATIVVELTSTATAPPQN